MLALADNSGISGLLVYHGDRFVGSALICVLPGGQLCFGQSISFLYSVKAKRMKDITPRRAIPVLASLIIVLAVAVVGFLTWADNLATDQPLPKTIIPAPNTTPTTDLSVTITDGVTFKPYADGYDLYANRGVVSYGAQGYGNMSPWIGPERLLVSWLSTAFDTDGIHEAYMLNLDKGIVEHLPGYQVGMSAYARPDGEKAVFLDLNNGGDYHRIYLSDVRTGAVETVYTPERAKPQWAGDEVHPKGQHMIFETGSVSWAGQDAFVVMGAALQPDEPSAQRDWNGTLLLADIVNRKTYIFKGFLLGTLPDGTVFISKDTATGEELDRIAPPYTNPPTVLSATGRWVLSLSAAPNGQSVSWVETLPVTGGSAGQQLLANQHQMCIDPCEYLSAPLSVAIWHGNTGEVSRIDLSKVGLDQFGIHLWARPLTWDHNSNSVLYNSKNTLYRFGLDGSNTILVRDSDWSMSDRAMIGTLAVVAASDDGSLYIMPYSSADIRLETPLYLRKPDGQLGTVDLGDPKAHNWNIDDYGRLLVLQDDRLTVTNLASGQVHEVSVPASIFLRDVSDPFNHLLLSPDGRWLAYSGEGDNHSFSLEGQEHGLVLRILRVK
jgi:hypothetical protein